MVGRGILILRFESWTAVFINTDDIPVKFESLNHFKYTASLDGSEVYFYRLYRDYYKHPQGYCNYPLERWRVISVKKHCVQAFINMIDGMEAAQEFIGL